jgi:hypothetical protein
MANDGVADGHNTSPAICHEVMAIYLEETPAARDFCAGFQSVLECMSHCDEYCRRGGHEPCHMPPGLPPGAWDEDWGDFDLDNIGDDSPYESGRPFGFAEDNQGDDCGPIPFVLLFILICFSYQHWTANGRPNCCAVPRRGGIRAVSDRESEGQSLVGYFNRGRARISEFAVRARSPPLATIESQTLFTPALPLSAICRRTCIVPCPA